MIWHGWPEDPRYSSLDGVRALVDEYNHAAAVAAVHGLQLGIHNHWWEMRRTEGTLPYQLLLTELDPAIFFELDTYWAQVAVLVLCHPPPSRKQPPQAYPPKWNGRMSCKRRCARQYHDVGC